MQVSLDADNSWHRVALLDGHHCASGTATAVLQVCRPEEIKQEFVHAA
jgi:hypothetical protein